MLFKLLHRVAGNPKVYDVIQRLAGAAEVYARIRRQIPTEGSAWYVLDVGGGTGSMRPLWPETSKYICLDIEMAKLQGFRSKTKSGLALLADATMMAIATGSADFVVFMFVAHHLSDDMWPAALKECGRVLKPGGKFFLIDPVMVRKNWIGRVMWTLDRGSYPRRAEALRRTLDAHFCVSHWEQFSVYHDYIFGIGVRS